MKKTIWLLCMLPLFCLLLGTAALPKEKTMASGISDRAEVLLFAPVADTHLLVYTDGTTQLCMADDSAAGTVVYPADRAFLHADAVSVVKPTAEYIIVERLDLENLQQTDLYSIAVPEKQLKAFAMDAQAGAYAVSFEAPSVLWTYDAAGSEVGSVELGEEICGIQMLENRLYVFLRERAICFDPEEGLLAVDGFSYPASAAAYHMLTPTWYVNTNGMVCSTKGEILEHTKAYELNEDCFAVADDFFFWAGGEEAVVRCSLSAPQTAKFAVNGTPAALTSTAVLVRREDAYICVPHGTFAAVTSTPVPTPVSSPTPVPTEAPVYTPTPVPTEKPANTATPVPATTPKPTATPKPTPTPVPLQVEFRDGYMFVPAGVTAAKLKAAYPDANAAVEKDGVTASGKLRTGWEAIVNGERYTIVIPGDINGSGTVNLADIRLLMRFLAGQDMPTELQMLAADLNENDLPDAADLVWLIRIRE